MEIKFGTSGWRDVIAENFTFDNVKLVTQAIADLLSFQEKRKISKEKLNIKSTQVRPTVIVGYDTRFLSEEFAKVASCVFAANNIKVLYCKRDVPTPVIAYEIVRRKLSGGINFTASHNPPEYNGLKLSPSWGGPATPEITNAIENSCAELLSHRERIKEVDFKDGLKRGLIKEISSEEEYIKRIKQLVDLNVIKKLKLKIAVDLLYGTARGYLDKILREIGCKIFVLHNWRDVHFGGGRPEPDEERLKEMKELQKKNKLHLGLSCDGDADRFGILDCDGTFITPNQVIALLLYHLAKSRSWRGIVVRSVMTSHFIDAIAKKFNIEVVETPVGFKYIGEIMVNRSKEFIIGGEESGGLTIRGHVPEKDGILACLLIAELVATESGEGSGRKSIRAILSELEHKVGRKYITKRINFSLTPERMSAVRVKLKSSPPKEFAGLKVKQLVTTDGFKFILEDDSWVGVRLSGTEPVVRLYLEADSEEKIQFLRSSSEENFSLK
ncbi:MAG: phosphoglucomutase/phosphomannomutase family protein [Elusimicrobiota bacterium]|nr:phosphoglucomutase/phosphomannomutase family protein [Elusimicrobiota bacterium]